MEKIEHIDERGRKYVAYQDGEALLIVGPPEELVDDLGLPEPLGTTLHNILYRRGILNFETAKKRPQELIGALQEAYRLDAQKLMDALFKYTQEVQHE